MGKIEEQTSQATLVYVESYGTFSECWENILAEHRDLEGGHGVGLLLLHAIPHKLLFPLVALLKLHDKAARTVAKLAEHKVAAATKNTASLGQPSTEATALHEAEVMEQGLNSQVVAKTLECQKVLHESLRRAYFTLHAARLAYYKKCIPISEAALTAIDEMKVCRAISV